MLAVDKQLGTFLYLQVVDFINDMMQGGTLKVGDKLPSLRKLSGQLNISIPTVKQAYIELERQGKIAARPQSGFYVKPDLSNRLKQLTGPQRQFRPVNVTCRDTVESVFRGSQTKGVVPLGITNPISVRTPVKSLNRAMRRVMSLHPERMLDYGPMNGYTELRRQLALRYIDRGLKVEPRNLLVTNGAQEALSIALQAVAQPGDVIAVESPTFFGILELIESLGMLALEVCTCPETGVCLESLSQALEIHDIRACLFSSSINNPLGSLMPDEKTAALVAFLEEREIPLLEDDVYGELFFSNQRPRSGQFYSRKGLVLTCSSFSKTAAPGYRIGWLIPGIYREAAVRIKRARSGSSPLLPQLALTEFTRSGEFDNHLHQMRKLLKAQMLRMAHLVAEHFPPDTLVSSPRGGCVLWLALPGAVDSVNLFHRLLQEGIGIAPGSIFSPCGKHMNFIRLSYGVVWSEEVDRAVARVGELVGQMATNSGLY